MKISVKHLYDITSEISEEGETKNELISSKMRTPINAILGFSNLLIEEKYSPLNNNQFEIVKNIKNTSELLLIMIIRLLDITKIDSGKHKFVKSKFSLNRTIDQVVSIFTPI